LSAKQFVFDSSGPASSESKGALLKHLRAYMENGGYPELVMKNFTPAEYLTTLFDSVLFKDVVNRFKVRFAQKMNDLGSYLLNNTGAEFSSRRLAAVLRFKSVSTVEKYLSHLEESYLIFVLNRFSFKTGERLGLPKKAYVVDNGYLAAKAVQSSPDNGRLMENLTFTELLKTGRRSNFDLFYYKTRNSKEVDFVLRDGAKTTELLQIAYDVSDPAVKNREVRALLEAGAELDCDKLTVITWDHEENMLVGKQNIEFMPLWKWLSR
jgi:predicted AAA+ superfamily ATPase